MALTKREENRRYRERRKARGLPSRSKPNRKLPNAFERGRFVAIDGEGFSDGPELSITIGAGEDARTYAANDHRYGLLMDSDGAELWAPKGRLHGKQCLDFLIDITKRDKDAIIVCFGSSYDTCHMLAHVLDRWDVQEVLSKSRKPGLRGHVDITLSHEGTTHDYRIEYKPRKEMKIWRFEHGASKYRYVYHRDGTRSSKLNPEARALLWDVWGFFQGSFMGALDNWLPGDPDYEFVKTMKGNRAHFHRSEIATIRKYTAAELRCLVTMMEKLRDSIRALDLQITRWDGAGAIAGAMFKKHGVKERMADTPQAVFDAARIGYSGGHIEACQIGFHQGKVYHNDVNSAYPDQFRNLPDLSRGEWASSRTDNPPRGFTLVRVEFHFEPGLAFYPLFYRTIRGEILYPERGSGWYWYEEFAAARDFASRFGAYTFRVIEWHHFHSRGNASPFSWIEDAYEQRKMIVAASRDSGVPDGREKTIKLGLNSCYGKTAQQVGARIVDGEISPPSYFQLEWAGFVTSGCRAKLMRAAMQKPHAIVSFATDALFSTEPLDLYAPPTKELGAWEGKVHSGMTIVMPGVYWTHDDDKIEHFSRGFKKEDMSDPQFVHDAWRKGTEKIMIRTERMVTLGAAMMSENFWKMRGLFVTSDRALDLTGANSKRYGVRLKQARPHKGLTPTWPKHLTEDIGQSLESLMSAPYPISWVDGWEDEEAEPDAAADAFFVNDRDAGSASFFV